MERGYDLNELKIKIFVEDNNIFVENNKKFFIFSVFYNKFTNKRSILFREISDGKMSLNDIIFAQSIIDKLKENN